MVDLIRCYVNRVKLPLTAKKTSQLPNSLQVERLTTQEVCTGLRSVMETLASENMDTFESVVKCILESIKQHGLNTWEADLCKISILSDSIKILTKSLKKTNDQSNQLLITIIDTITVICRDRKSHSTLKLITLNGLGGLANLPENNDDYAQLVMNLIDVFIDMLDDKADVDDLIISETLKATQRLLLNAPSQFTLGMASQAKLLTLCRLYSTRTNSQTRKSALELLGQLAQIKDGALKDELTGSLFSVLLALADSDEQVRCSAQLALVAISNLLSTTCAELITKHCGANTRLHTGEFTAEFVSRLVQSMDGQLGLALFNSCQGKK